MAARLAAVRMEAPERSESPELTQCRPFAMISGLAQLSYNDAGRRDDKRKADSRRGGASNAGAILAVTNS
jgi:hypothetical protein